MDTLQRFTALATTAVLLGACAGGPFAAEGPIPTVPEEPPPPVPTLSEATTAAGEAADLPTGTEPSPPAEPPAQPTDEPDEAASPPADPAETPPDSPPQDPVELGRTLGVQGLADLLADDPEQAGPRGDELHRDLQDLADGANRRRVERLQDRVEEWLDKDELDPQIAQAVQAALAQQLEELPPGGSGDDDDDD